MNIKERMKELNIVLPAAPQKGGMYSPVKRFGEKLLYVSGCGPKIDEPVEGKLGQEFTVEEGKVFSRNSMLNVLAAVDENVGLENVKCPVKLLTFVAGTADFYDQPAVANGGSVLLVQLFGEDSAPSRSAIGCSSLPGNIPVETEAVFELL